MHMHTYACTHTCLTKRPTTKTTRKIWKHNCIPLSANCPWTSLSFLQTCLLSFFLASSSSLALPPPLQHHRHLGRHHLCPSGDHQRCHHIHPSSFFFAAGFFRIGPSSSVFGFRVFLPAAFFSISPFSSDVLSSEELAISQRCKSEAVGRLGPYGCFAYQ